MPDGPPGVGREWTKVQVKRFMGDNEGPTEIGNQEMDDPCVF